ncbi:MAG TPA: patatin-like phospholipase family protein [Candidatus Dormibacteraeota bacterium]|nr:patatin-like phospholipase family protein [Candidatus Dormibacteraeota bacterium]
MSEPILLAGRDLKVDRKKIGISYSGGGAMVLIELGIANAFVDLGIVPAVIAGASSGALAGAAHALDPVGGAGIRIAAAILGGVTNRTLGLGIDQVIGRLVLERQNLTSLGDHTPLRLIIRDELEAKLGLTNVTIGYFRPPSRPRLMVVATNRLSARSVWFPAPTPIADALLASAAIPGIFPWQTIKVRGRDLTLVDGGVVDNQPLTQLALAGCGTIFACAVGYVGGAIPPPTNAINNAVNSIWITVHQATKLEEQMLRERLRTRGDIFHIHPEVNFPVDQFNFTDDLVAAVMEESRSKTIAWLHRLGF